MFANDVPRHTEQSFRWHAGGRRCKVHLYNFCQYWKSAGIVLPPHSRKVEMFESSKSDKSGLKSGGHIQPGPDFKKRPDSSRGRT